MEFLCEVCRFWLEISDMPQMGFCRRQVPLAVLINPVSEVFNFDAQWPGTKPEDWCGKGDGKIKT